MPSGSGPRPVAACRRGVGMGMGNGPYPGRPRTLGPRRLVASVPGGAAPPDGRAAVVRVDLGACPVRPAVRAEGRGEVARGGAAAAVGHVVFVRADREG